MRNLTRRNIALLVAAPLLVALPAAALGSQPTGPGGAPAADSSAGYIVRLRDAASLEKTIALNVALGGVTVEQLYRHVFRGFAAELTAPAAARLRQDPAVAEIVRNTTVRAQNTASWGLDRIDQRALPLSGTYDPPGTGAGITVYVIDSGIRASHQEFGGRVSRGYDAYPRERDDCNGHGTHVAGTIGGATYGVATAARLVSVRVLDCQARGLLSDVIAGIEWATLHHQAGVPAVANMSLGTEANSLLDAAVRSSVADGITYSVSAGNNGRDACLRSPARVDEVLTASATEQRDMRPDTANFGPCVDLFAPGASIPSAWHSGDSDTMRLHGTSMASAHVAGVAALHLQATPTAAPADVMSAVTAHATPLVVHFAGKGSPNRLLYSGLTDLVGELTAPAEDAVDETVDSVEDATA